MIILSTPNMTEPAVVNVTVPVEVDQPIQAGVCTTGLIVEVTQLSGRTCKGGCCVDGECECRENFRPEKSKSLVNLLRIWPDVNQMIV